MATAQTAVQANTTPEASSAESTEFISQFMDYMRSGYRAIWLQTTEISRLRAEMTRARRSGIAKRDFQVISWDVVSGFELVMSKDEEKALDTNDRSRNRELERELAKQINNLKGFQDPSKALDAMRDSEIMNDVCVVLMQNLDDFLGNITIMQRVQNYCEADHIVEGKPQIHRLLVVVTSKATIPEKLKHYFAHIKLKLPDRNKLRSVIEQLEKPVGKPPVPCDPSLRTELAIACQGLTTLEAENALALGLVHEGKKFTPGILKLVHDYKASSLAAGGVLRYIPANEVADVNDIGGYDNLLVAAQRDAASYTEEAIAAKIDYPRGFLLIGVPGTGKSTIALMFGKILRLPVMIFNFAGVFGSLVGQSQARMAASLEAIEALNGCVVLFDEVDKAMGMAEQSINDSTRQVFGQLLSWMASPSRGPAYVIMTGNRADQLDPALIRAGRLDAVWATGLPSAEERRSILEIHLRKRNTDPAQLPLDKRHWTQLLEKTKNYVGAELEQVVINARKISWQKRKSTYPDFAELTEAATEVNPLAKRDPAAFKAVVDFCDAAGGRAVSSQMDTAAFARGADGSARHIE